MLDLRLSIQSLIQLGDGDSLVVDGTLESIALLANIERHQKGLHPEKNNITDL